MKVINVSHAFALSTTMLLGVSATLYGDTFQVGDVVWGTNQGETVEWYRGGTQVADLNPSASGGVAASVAFDAAGNLYVSQEGTVGKFDTHGNFLGTFATTASGQWGGLVFNNAGDLFAGTTNGGLTAGSGIFEFNSSGSLLHNYLPGTIATGLALESNQNTILFTDESDVLHSLNLTTGTEGTFAITAGGSDAGLTVLPNGDVLVAGYTSNEIYLLDSHGNLIKEYGFASPDGVALDPTGTSFWATSYFNSTFEAEEINVSTGSVEQMITGSNLRDAGIAVYEGSATTSATPEPGSLALLGTALVGVFLSRRCHRGKL